MRLSSHGLGLCVTCRQPVRWSITAAGKRQALNPDPDERGNTVAFCDGLGVWRSRRPTTELPQAAHERLFMPHAATCPNQRAVPEHRLPAGVVSLAARRRAKRARR
ncbi:hypothetical protein ABIA32_002737 [Streptacidiphilus sp. MAP12-20]|uniref:hypothetical protein n=1 Tax=Streptacidiphilus sp. MAP12-20 TaxID=3156299 RepID=UPI003514D322